MANPIPLDDHRRQILVIENHVGVGTALGYALAAQGYETLGPARTLSHGLELAPDADAVLLDVNLPDAQGTEAVHALRAAHPELPLLVHATSVADPLRGALRRIGVEVFIKGEVEPMLDILARPGFFGPGRRSL